jgi:hypothetical protein
MSPKAMRSYVAPLLVCSGCRMRIHGEVRMVAGLLYHPECATRLPKVPA